MDRNLSRSCFVLVKMAYFVIAPDGSKYGPAEIDLLQKWIGENRIFPNTMLEDSATGHQIQASQVPGLSFQQNWGQPPSNQQPNYYSRPSAGPFLGSTDKDIQSAWIWGVVGLLCCGPAAIVGFLAAQRAKQAGDPRAQAPYIFCIVAMCLWVIGFLGRGFFFLDRL